MKVATLGVFMTVSIDGGPAKLVRLPDYTGSVEYEDAAKGFAQVASAAVQSRLLDLFGVEKPRA